VRLRALGWLQARAAPADLASFKKLCDAIAVAYAKDAQRKRQRRAPYDTGPCEDPDAHVADAYKERQWDPIDTQRLLDILEVHLRAAKVPECAFTILDAEAAGVTHAEIGEELGLTDRTVRCQLARMRDGFRDRVATRGLSVLAPPARGAGKGESVAERSARTAPCSLPRTPWNPREGGVRLSYATAYRSSVRG
jgi:DNA-directed RNA polymerase specialized sigma24 family protein